MDQNPIGHQLRSLDELVGVYRRTKSIAVVGASQRTGRPGHYVPRYLQRQGYRILPVNPRGGELLGERVHRSLREIDEPVDVVQVFRLPAEAEGIARDAVAIGARVLWFQPETYSDAAVYLAVDAGLLVVAGRCMGAVHGLLGLGCGPRVPGGTDQ